MMSRPRVTGDRGSITPLIIGMVLCLLLLGFGVIAMGSVVLAKRSLQNACDSTADYVTGSTTQADVASATDGYFDQQARAELHRRVPAATVSTGTQNSSLIAVCAVQAPIALGGLFGSPTVSLQVRSVSQLRRD